MRKRMKRLLSVMLVIIMLGGMIPQTFVTVKAEGEESNDATLSSLTFSQGELNTGFSKDNTKYTLTVAKDTTDITVTPVTSVSGAAITVNGSMVKNESPSETITVEDTGVTVTIVVTALDTASTKTYTVYVKKEASSTVVTSGYCGNNGINLTWSLTGEEGNYTLTISGTGKMSTYSLAYIPWASYKASITKLVLSEGITSISEWAFYGCSNLSGTLTIPNTVTSIGGSAFQDCSKLTGNLSIPEGVTVINGYTFWGCSGLTGRLSIPEGVTSIVSYAFKGCSGFSEAVIPTSVESIGYWAFQQWSSGSTIYNLSNVTMGATITNSLLGEVYTITLTDGTNISTTKAMKDGTGVLVLPEGQVREGIAFLGWYDADGLKWEAGTALTDSNVPSGSLSLTARYKADAPTMDDVIFDYFNETVTPKRNDLEIAMNDDGGNEPVFGSFTDIVQENGGYFYYLRVAAGTDYEASDYIEIFQHTVAPVIEESEITVLDNSITLPVISGTEYSISKYYDIEGIWQDSNVFTELTPKTTYYLSVRYKATSSSFASESYNQQVTTTKTQLTGTPTATGTYGDALFNIAGTLQGEVKDSFGNVISGSWKWDNLEPATTCPAVNGTTTYCAVFTPSENEDLYEPLTADIIPEMKPCTIQEGDNLTVKNLSEGITYTGSEIINPFESLYNPKLDCAYQEDVDYQLTYSNNINVGTAKVTIKGIGNYTGELNLEFSITKAAPIINAPTDAIMVTYGDTLSLKGITNSINVPMAFTTEDTDILVVDSNGTVSVKGVGMAQVTASIAETGNYEAASTVLSINIVKKDISNVPINREYQVVTNHAGEYTLNLADLLPTLSGYEEYKDLSFGVLGTEDIAGILTEVPSVGEVTDGILIIKTAAVSEMNKTALVGILVKSQYFNDFAIALKVRTVDPIQLTISEVLMPDRIYNGSSYEYTGSPVFSNISNSETVADIAYTKEYEGTGTTNYVRTTEAPVNAGNYQLILTVSDSKGYYDGSLEVPFEITKKEVILSVMDKTITMGANIPSLATPILNTDYTVSGLLVTDTLGGTLVMNYIGVPDNSRIGSFEITISGGTVSDNYSIQNKAGTLIIKTNTAAIEEAIMAAGEEKENISIYDKAESQVSKGILYVATEAMNALNAAINSAEHAKDSITSMEEVQTVIETLNDAVNVFKDSIKTGTYEASSDSGNGDNSTSEPNSNSGIADNNAADEINETKTTVEEEGKTKEIITLTDANGNALTFEITKDMEGNTTASISASTTITTETKNGTTTVKCGIDSQLIMKAAEMAKEAGTKLNLSVTIPENELMEQIRNVSGDIVSINIEIPKEIKDNADIQISTVTLTTATIRTAQAEGKTLITTVIDGSGNMVIWKFNTDLLKVSNRKITDTNLIMKLVPINSLGNTDSVKQQLNTGEANNNETTIPGIELNFEHNGLLPTTAQVRFYVCENSKITGIQPGSKVYLYYYDEESGKFLELPNTEYTVDEEGYISIDITHCSDYVLLPNKIESGTISLLDQITVSAKKNLYVGGINNTGKVGMTCPDTLMVVKNFSQEDTDLAVGEVIFTYKSSNSKVVTVSATGKLKAKKKGKATITVTAKLSDGTIKTYTQKVTVKK